jgi:lipoate-protein ligase A
LGGDRGGIKFEFMYYIVSPTNDPFFNMAAEEYLFRNFVDDVFFLYINKPSVVVGKHQNAMAEINPVYVYENNIKVIRRMSGGGAVYHDTGNVNFSFHKTFDDAAKVRFSEFSIPVVQILNEMGVPAAINTRNDIVVNGFKVSGHAQHVFRNRVMSHGTLLINSDLEKLSDTLRKSKGNYVGKAIQSIRSKVANISSFTTDTISTEGFCNHLIQYIIQTIQGANEYKFSDSDINPISELAGKKYSSWDWNFGYSPVYQFTNEIVLSCGISMTCFLSVEKGLIKELKFVCGLLSENERERLINGLINQPHHPEFMTSFLERVINLPISTSQLIKLFFC